MTPYLRYEDSIELIHDLIFKKNPRFQGFDPTTGNGFIKSDSCCWCYSRDLPKIIQWFLKRSRTCYLKSMIVGN